MLLKLVLATLALTDLIIHTSAGKSHLQYGLENSIYDDYDDSDEPSLVSSTANTNLNKFTASGDELGGPKFGSVSSASAAYYNNLNVITNKTSSILNFNLNKCRNDLNCNSDSICNTQTGTCVKLCDMRLRLSKAAAECVYFHCDGKQLFIVNGNQSLSEEDFRIETNNFPKLNRYLNKRRCAWILKNNLKITEDNLESNNDSSLIQRVNIPVAQLQVDRFSTEFANDFLYIFAGDSIYSPLVATLR